MKDYRVHEINWTDEKVSRLWDYYSNNRPFNEVYFTKQVGRDILLRTFKETPITENTVILDFGCGPAFFIDHLSGLGLQPKKYIGLDFSKQSVENVLKKESDFLVEGVFTDSLPSKIANKSIDICFFIEVIEHLNDEHLRNTLNEICRVLKPGGTLIITTPNNEDLTNSHCFCPDCGCIYHKWQHIRSFNSDSLIKEVNKHGFYDKKVITTNLKHYDIGLLKNIKHYLKLIFSKGDSNLFGVFIKL